MEESKLKDDKGRRPALMIEDQVYYLILYAYVI